MIIYKITNLLNDKIYIGQTTLSIEKRFLEHVHQSRKNRKDMPILNVIRKYGKENFDIEPLYICKNQNDLDEKEISFIKNLNPEYNVRIGGKGGNLSKEQKKKISDSNKGKLISKETRKKMSLAKKGKKQSKESIEKRSKSIKGIFLGEKHPHTSLTNKQVVEIKKLILSGMKNSCIAKLYNVKYDVIYRIKSGRTWQSVTIST